MYVRGYEAILLPQNMIDESSSVLTRQSTEEERQAEHQKAYWRWKFDARCVCSGAEEDGSRSWTRRDGERGRDLWP